MKNRLKAFREGVSVLAGDAEQQAEEGVWDGKTVSEADFKKSKK
jgi:hypothetical protein